MVTVTGYHIRKRKDGETFVVLTLTAGLEIVQSSTTGQFRAVVRKCQIPSNLDEPTAQLMVGSQLPGQIIRTQSDPYDFTDPKTGEVMTLSHRWSYVPEGATAAVPTTDLEEELV